MNKTLYLSLISFSEIMRKKILWVVGLLGLAIFVYFLIAFISLPRLEDFRIEIDIDMVLNRAFDQLMLISSKVGNVARSTEAGLSTLIPKNTSKKVASSLCHSCWMRICGWLL